MRIDKFVPEHKRTGLSVYYDDYKKRLSVDCTTSKPTSVSRRNRPHPPKNFLFPQKEPDESVELQNQVRRAVRRYVSEVYHSDQNNRDCFHPPPVFATSGEEQDYSTLQRPKTASLSHVRGLGSRQSWPRPQPIVASTNSLHVLGHGIGGRPASTVQAEVNPPTSLQGESKRDRSVRIEREIKKKTRLTTPVPKRQTWQDDKVREVAENQKPHWVGDPAKARKATKTRIQSAPIGKNGYTYYPQSKIMGEPTEDMTSRLESWAKHASNYEKQVVFKMLKQVTPRIDQTPETPSTDQFMRAISFPDNLQEIQDAYEMKPAVATKKRNVMSAPVKKAGGIVSSSHQRPLRDQRTFRLRGQDHRIDPTPQEERNLNLIMDKMRATSYPVTKGDRKYVPVPMHHHLTRKATGSEDYQCKVSFFQTVRSPFKSHFVIHPDFTSESLKQRKPVSHMITHFRY